MMTLREAQSCNTDRIRCYVVLGDPIPLARARIGGSGKAMWDAQRQIKLVWGIHLSNQHKGPLLVGPLHADLIFYVEPPKLKAATYYGNYCAKRPDLDNLIKFVLDVANEIVYQDDNCVASITAKKIYDQKPRTEIIFCQMDPK